MLINVRKNSAAICHTTQKQLDVLIRPLFMCKHLNGVNESIIVLQEYVPCSTLHSRLSVHTTVLPVIFFNIWSLIIAEVADWSHRKQSDKQVSKVGTGAAALLLHSCHCYTVSQTAQMSIWGAFAYQFKPCTHTHTDTSSPFPVHKCVNYFLHLAKAHLLFHYISDVSPQQCVCEWAWHRAEHIGPGKEASPKGGRVTQQRERTVIISSLHEFSLGKWGKKNIKSHNKEQN